jgi:hypothetical protein
MVAYIVNAMVAYIVNAMVICIVNAMDTDMIIPWLLTCLDIPWIDTTNNVSTLYIYNKQQWIIIAAGTN